MPVLPPEPIDWLLARADFSGTAAPLLALVVGLALAVSPVSWPTIPAVVSLVTPAARAGTVDGLVPEPGVEQPAPLSRRRSALVVLGFVIGMDGVLAGLGAVAVGVTEVLVRTGAVCWRPVASGRRHRQGVPPLGQPGGDRPGSRQQLAVVVSGCRGRARTHRAPGVPPPRARGQPHPSCSRTFDCTLKGQPDNRAGVRRTGGRLPARVCQSATSKEG